MTYQEACRQVTNRLKELNIEDAASDAWILLEYVTGMDRTRFYVDGMRKMPEEQEQRYLMLAAKREQRIPVQHLTGTQEFMGMEFHVNEHVLVPRQDTEILVEAAEQVIRRITAEKNAGDGEAAGADQAEEHRDAAAEHRDAAANVLDMCTGSGCIAISLQARNPQIRCMAADISEAALEVARQNARELGADVTFVKSDMFDRIEGSFDLIVSNPPYIPTRVIEELEEEVRLHDPFGALDGREDGLHFYRILAELSPRYLKNGGHLYMEIGHDQSEAVEELLRGAGFEQIRTQKDLAGLDRVVSGVYNRHS